MQHGFFKIHKTLRGSLVFGLLLSCTTIALAGHYVMTRMASAEQDAGQFVPDVVITILVLASLYSALHALRCVFLRQRALQSQPKEERARFERTGNLAARFAITLSPDSASAVKTFRVTPKERASVRLFDNTEKTAQIYYDNKSTFPLALKVGENIVYPDLNATTRGVKAIQPLTVVLKRAGIISGAIAVVFVIFVVCVREDWQWWTAMTAARSGDLTESKLSDTPIDKQSTITRLLELSCAKDTNDLRHSYGQVVAAMEYTKLGDYSQAEEILDRAYGEAKRASDPVPHLALLTFAQATLASKKGETQKAITLYEESTKLWQQLKARGVKNLEFNALGWYKFTTYSPSEQIAAIVQKLATLHDDLGNPDAAERNYKEAIESLKKKKKASHQYFCAIISLERFYRRHGMPDKAAEEAKVLLSELEEEFWNSNEELANGLERYGGICTIYGEFVPADLLLKKAVGLREKALIQEKKESVLAYAQALCMLADNYRYAGRATKDFSAAIPLYQRAVGIYKGTEIDSASYTWPMLGLAEIALLGGEVPVATEKQPVTEKPPATDKPQTTDKPATGDKPQATADKQTGTPDEPQATDKQPATPDKSKATDKQPATAGPEIKKPVVAKLDVATTINTIEKILRVRTNARGENHVDLVWPMYVLANYYRDSGDLKKAEPYYTKALLISAHRVPPKQIEFIRLRRDYGEFLRRANRLQEAAEVDVQVKKLEASSVW